MLGPWFFEPVAGVLWRGRFSPVSLWRGEHVPDGAGGADWRATQRYRSEAFRVLDLEGPYPMSAVRIDIVERQQSEAGAYRFPGGAMARLIVEGEPAGQTPPPLPLRSIQTRRVAGARRPSIHRLEVCRLGEWLPATLKPVELSKL
jgi:hypothetical protein